MMKRLVFIPLLFFAACQQGSPLPPEEVLKRAAVASQELESARYHANVEFAGGKDDGIGGRGVVTVDGRLQGGGVQTQLALQLDGEIRMPGVPASSVQADLDIIVAGRDEVYLRINSVESNPSFPLLSSPILQEFQGQWWQLRDNGSYQSPSSVTPDPRLLRAQSEVVRVARDHGIERYDSRNVYRYDVVFDPEKFASFLGEIDRLRGEEQPNGAGFDPLAVTAALLGVGATGQLWIDAETFLLRRIEWDVSVKTGETDFLNVSLQVHLFDHGQAPAITLPDGAKMFVPSVTLRNPNLVSPLEDQRGSEGLSQESEQEILDALLEETQ